MAELIIVFREVLEASLIIGILYTYLKQTGNVLALKYLWQGVGYALIASIFGSILFQLVAGGFHGKAEKIFEGVVMIIASITLGSMIIWMAKNQNIAAELKEKADDSLNQENIGRGILWLSFISVFREGIETILFLYSVVIKEGSLNIFLSLLGALIGIGIGYLIFIQGRKIPVKTFFNISSILLIFVASGMLAYGVHELESAEIIKNYGRIWDINPEKNINGSYPAFHDKGSIGGLFKGLFGYNGNPSLIELIVWLFSLTGLLYMYNSIKTSPVKASVVSNTDD